MFPGACAECGGPQVWTLHRGEVFVACQLDCGHTFYRLAPPPDGEGIEWFASELIPQLELFGEEGAKPLEGGDAD